MCLLDRASPRSPSSCPGSSLTEHPFGLGRLYMRFPHSSNFLRASPDSFSGPSIIAQSSDRSLSWQRWMSGSTLPCAALRLTWSQCPQRPWTPAWLRCCICARIVWRRFSASLMCCADTSAWEDDELLLLLLLLLEEDEDDDVLLLDDEEGSRLFDCVASPVSLRLRTTPPRL